MYQIQKNAVLGFKSFNGLVGAIPVEIPTGKEAEKKFLDLIQEKHSYSIQGSPQFLYQLEITEQAAYSTMWPINTRNLFPKSLRKNEMYWYLTPQGWRRWDHINDMSTMKIGLNVYEIKHSNRMDIFGAISTPTSSLWDAVTERYEFEREAGRLIKKYGHSPDISEWCSESELQPYEYKVKAPIDR